MNFSHVDARIANGFLVIKYVNPKEITIGGKEFWRREG
jgi:hypothetical protein